ncbi:hypothetical protein CLF_113187 [Clonorchis sinensis]|uniref:ZSWIM1/3 RNaseH-like domain-containing protein n=1 Tax=Clonorchis sinensis TaxID=79923 RepID=G7YXU8_CLOSI|nr:hypothetical protein CLF_113187 [Clonorchis sinensis]
MSHCRKGRASVLKYPCGLYWLELSSTGSSMTGNSEHPYCEKAYISAATDGYVDLRHRKHNQATTQFTFAVLLDDMPSVLEKLRGTGRVLVWQSEEGHYSHICFSRWQEIALFRRFPDVVNVDGKHAKNRFDCKLYTFLVMDGISAGRPVMYAFVESNQSAYMRKLFELFKEMMREYYPVRKFVMDTLAALIRASRIVFGCEGISAGMLIRYVAASIRNGVEIVRSSICEKSVYLLMSFFFEFFTLFGSPCAERIQLYLHERSRSSGFRLTPSNFGYHERQLNCQRD